MTASTALKSNPLAIPPPDEAMLDTGTAAELLACSPRTVTSLITRGHLPALRLGPGRTAYRIPASALLAFAQRYGLQEPEVVAAAQDAADLPEVTLSPVALEVAHDPDGMKRVRLWRPPDPDPGNGG